MRSLAHQGELSERAVPVLFTRNQSSVLRFGPSTLTSQLPPMLLLYTLPDLHPENGGPPRSVTAMAEAVALHLLTSDPLDSSVVKLMALHSAHRASAPILPKYPVHTTLVPGARTWPGHFNRTAAFSRALVQNLRHGSRALPCILHDNGVWLPTNHAAATAARYVGAIFVVSPRGMLTDWALHFHRFKKAVAWWLYQRRDLWSAHLLHATALSEAHDFRRLGLRQPIAVIPNGVHLPDSPAPHVTSSNGSSVTHTHTALFLSRLHPKKGLLDLVEAWHAIRPTGWHMVIAGRDEHGHRAAVESAIRARGLQQHFQFVGEMTDSTKWQLYQSADLFILPTRSENFGLVIAEALACGVPVITTQGAPWQDLASHDCGWWIPLGVSYLAEALQQATRLPDEQRRARGTRGRKLVQQKYPWSAAAAQMLEVYRWLLGGRERPDCVV